MSPEQTVNSSITCATEAPDRNWWEVIIDFTVHLTLFIVKYLDSGESVHGVSWSDVLHMSPYLIPNSSIHCASEPLWELQSEFIIDFTIHMVLFQMSQKSVNGGTWTQVGSATLCVLVVQWRKVMFIVWKCNINWDLAMSSLWEQLSGEGIHSLTH